MLKRLYFCIILIVILLILTGCKDFYTFNLFEGLDYVAVPTAAQLNEKPPAEGVDYLKEQFTSDSFMDTVADDPEAAGEIAAYLATVYTDTAGTIETPVQVAAAVLAADLQLAVSGGDDFIANVWNALDDIQALTSGGGEDNSAVIQSVLTGIIPETTDQTAFTTLVTGLLAAGDIYKTLGTDIIINATTAPADNSGGDITGGVVFNAAVTGVISTIVSTLLLPSYTDEEGEAAVVLWNLFTSEDPTLVEGVNPAADMSTVFDNLTYLENIAIAVGFDLTAVFGQAE